MIGGHEQLLSQNELVETQRQALFFSKQHEADEDSNRTLEFHNALTLLEEYFGTLVQLEAAGHPNFQVSFSYHSSFKPLSAAGMRV